MSFSKGAVASAKDINSILGGSSITEQIVRGRYPLQDWTSLGTVLGTNVRSIVYGNGYFVALKSDDTVWRCSASNVASWSQIGSVSSTDYKNLFFCGGKFFISCDFIGYTNIWVSDDGSSWKYRVPSDASSQSDSGGISVYAGVPWTTQYIDYINGTWLFFYLEDAVLRIATSTDGGETWLIQSPSGTPYAISGVSGYFATDDGHFVFMASDDKIYYSTDSTAKTWETLGTVTVSSGSYIKYMINDSEYAYVFIRSNFTPEIGYLPEATSIQCFKIQDAISTGSITWKDVTISTTTIPTTVILGANKFLFSNMYQESCTDLRFAYATTQHATISSASAFDITANALAYGNHVFLAYANSKSSNGFQGLFSCYDPC